MSAIKIIIETEAPEQCETRQDLCAVVKELIDEIDSGHPSRKAWKRLRWMFNKLAHKRSLTTKQRQVFELMEPIMKKYGQLDVDGVELMASYPHEGADSVRYANPDEETSDE